MIKKYCKTMYAVKYRGRLIGGITNPELWNSAKRAKNALGKDYKDYQVVKVKLTTEVNMDKCY